MYTICAVVFKLYLILFTLAFNILSIQNELTFHSVEIFDMSSAGVKKFTPQKLPNERDWWLRVLPLLEDLLQSPVHRSY